MYSPHICGISKTGKQIQFYLSEKATYTMPREILFVFKRYTVSSETPDCNPSITHPTPGQRHCKTITPPGVNGS